MKIALDLEGVLLSKTDETPDLPTPTVARRFFRRGVRQEARALLRDLARAGHSLTIYSTASEHPAKLWLWCRLSGLPVERVITVEQEKRRLQQKAQKKQKRFAKDLKTLGLTHFGVATQVDWPPFQGQDMIFDDDASHVLQAWRTGIKGLIIAESDSQWTSRIRGATLEGHGIEVVGEVQVA
jgi:hypothetical protein